MLECRHYLGGTYVLCEVCQEQHSGISVTNPCLSTAHMQRNDRQEFNREISSVLAPDLLPAPLATMEGRSFVFLSGNYISAQGRFV